MEYQNDAALPPLTPDALYAHEGLTLIAISEDTMVNLMAGSSREYQRNEETTFRAAKGSEEWSTYMARTVKNMRQANLDLHRVTTSSQQAYWDLGEALREEAENRGWCNDYNEFAERWDLPLLLKTFEVTVEISLQAANEGVARDIVDRWDLPDELDDDGVVLYEPHVNIREA